MKAMMFSLAMLSLLGCLCAGEARAEIVGEGVDVVRCSEGEEVELPKRLELLQSVLSDHFADLGRIGLAVTVDYEDAQVSQGKVIATAFLSRAGAPEVKLGKVVARVREGEAEKFRIVNSVIEAGDEVRWRVKIRGMAPLQAGAEHCWSLGLALYVADQLVQ